MVIHIECLPDETLLKKLGYSRKQIEHHQGKSRVLGKISSLKDQIGLIDEDPMAAQHTYEQSLITESISNGVTLRKDVEKNNKVLILKVKLEDWIISACKKSHIEPADFGLPNKPNELHSVINNRIAAYERLLDALLAEKNPNLLTLKACLEGK